MARTQNKTPIFSRWTVNNLSLWLAVFCILPAAFVCSGLSGCSKKDSGEEFLPATVVYFEEAEPGIDPYPVRMIVTKRWMRIDNGRDDDDFLVFDRSELKISSINRMDQSVFLVKPDAKEIPSEGQPKIERETYADADMPTLEGVKPTHKSISVGDKLCRDTVAVQGMMPDVVDASKEYLTTLSLQQFQLLNKTPPEMRDPCMLVNLIYRPTEHLSDGFPVRESDYRGFVRELTGFEELKVPPRLFEVPQEFKVVEIR